MRLVLIITLLLATSLAHAKRRVLITAFEPFMGRSINGSQSAAEALEKLNHTQGIEYVFCNLPVVYDQAAAKAQECYDKMDPKPEMVISLGEGGCDIRLETRGQNFDNAPSISDNKGNIHEKKVIKLEARPYEIFNMPIAEMFCSVENVNLGPPRRTSTSAGFFVCNNTAFHLARFFKQRGVPYSFIHVPVAEGYCPNNNPNETAKILHTMNRSALTYIFNNGCEEVNPRIPQVQDLLEVANSACQEEFSKQAAGIYDASFSPQGGDVAN